MARQQRGPLARLNAAAGVLRIAMKPQIQGRAGGVPFLLGSFISTCMAIAMMLNSASTALQSTSPGLALSLNPLNAEARVNLAYERLNAERDAPDPETVDIINEGIIWSPLDARFVSLMGLAAEQSDDLDTAKQLFDHALKILPTELLALTHSLGIAFEAGQLSETINHLEVIGRRWGYWQAIDAVFPELLEDKSALASVTSRFARDQDLRALLINSLSSSSEGLAFVPRILLDWNNRNLSDLGPLVNRATARLIADNRHQEAFALFNKTLARDPRRGRNLVYNGEFLQEISGNRFDWSIRRQAGIEFKFLSPPSTDQVASGKSDALGVAGTQGGLAIRFLGTPVRMRNVGQLIRAPAGNYHLTVTYSAKRLKAPKPVRMRVDCFGSNRHLGQLEFNKGNVKTTRSIFSFSVPTTDCPLQYLSVATQAAPKSWRQSYRYSGTLVLERVAITSDGV